MVAVAYGQSISLYAKPVAGGSQVSIGSLETEGFNLETKNVVLPAGDYCVGTGSLPNHECFSYVSHTKGDILAGLVVTLALDESIARLSIGKDGVKVKPAHSLPSPNLKPATIEKKKEKVVDEKGEEVEEDTRSWIQRNWIYVVPPLLIFMLVAPDGK